MFRWTPAVKKLWAATTQFAVNVGDTVAVGAGVPMSDYHSKSLNRDFDVVYFTGSIAVGSNAGASPALPPGHPPLTGAATPALPPGHPALTAAAAAPNLDLTGIKRAAGGKTIKEIYAAKAKLAGQTVSSRQSGEIQRHDSGQELAAYPGRLRQRGQSG